MLGVLSPELTKEKKIMRGVGETGIRDGKNM